MRGIARIVAVALGGSNRLIQLAWGIRYVLQNGRLYDGLRLDEIGNRSRRRQDFYFERPGGQGGVTTVGTDED